MLHNKYKVFQVFQVFYATTTALNGRPVVSSELSKWVDGCPVQSRLTNIIISNGPAVNQIIVTHLRYNSLLIIFILFISKHNTSIIITYYSTVKTKALVLLLDTGLHTVVQMLLEIRNHPIQYKLVIIKKQGTSNIMLKQVKSKDFSNKHQRQAADSMAVYNHYYYYFI